MSIMEDPDIISRRAEFEAERRARKGNTAAPQEPPGFYVPPGEPAGFSRKKPSLVSGAKLLNMEFQPVRYVVPRYVAEGATILAGRPKLGKSWLALEMAIAVATGGTCLGGVECEQGDVLYLALEDNLRRLQNRLDRLMPPGARGPENLDFATEWARANDGGLDDLRQWLVEHNNARLVIVDVLAMFRPARGGKEQLYDGDYGAIKGLQSLAMEFGVAIVIVHHTRKGGSDGDAFEKVSGTLGLSGAADTTLILDRDGNGATLYGRGRDIQEIETAVAFDRDTCKWSILGQAAEVRKTDERKEILSVLIDADAPMNPREISVAAGMARNNVDQLLYKLGKSGEIQKVGRGLYVHPERRDLIDAHTSTPDKNDKKIRKGEGAPQEPGTSGSPAILPANGAIRNEGERDERKPQGNAALPAEHERASYHLTDLIAPHDLAGKKDRDDDDASNHRGGRA